MVLRVEIGLLKREQHRGETLIVGQLAIVAIDKIDQRVTTHLRVRRNDIGPQLPGFLNRLLFGFFPPGIHHGAVANQRADQHRQADPSRKLLRSIVPS